MSEKKQEKKELSDILNLMIRDKSTTVLSIRIKPIVHILYQTLSRDEIQELKQIISAYVVARAVEKGINIPEDLKRQYAGIFEKREDARNIIFNINVNKNENTVNNNNNINIDFNAFVSKLNELEKLLLQIQTHNWDKNRNAYVLPPARLQDLNNMIKDLKRFLVN